MNGRLRAPNNVSGRSRFAGDLAYIAEDNPVAAERFGVRLIEKVELLKTFPKLGKKVKGTQEDRVLVEGPILIFYRADVAACVIEIKRFWHGARGTRAT